MNKNIIWALICLLAYWVFEWKCLNNDLNTQKMSYNQRGVTSAMIDSQRAKFDAEMQKYDNLIFKK